MDIISAIILLSLVAAPLALLAGWFVDGGHTGLGSLVSRGGSDAWWRAAMPWPQGVQEEDGVRWHVQDQGSMAVDSSATGPATRGAPADDFEITLLRPQARVAFRPSRDRDPPP
jgi:hypothetical protein